jgi:tRNA 2-thiouridine synthesizing protein A
MSMTVVQTLDLKGLSCPMPIIKTAKAMKQVSSGEMVEVFATDPGSVADFKAWCKSTGNTLVGSDEADGVFHYIIQKR